MIQNIHNTQLFVFSLFFKVQTIIHIQHPLVGLDRDQMKVYNLVGLYYFTKKNDSLLFEAFSNGFHLNIFYQF